MPGQPHSPRPPRSPDPVKFWTDILERLEPSGLTHVAFCRREGIPPSSFYTWRRRLRPTMSGVSKAAPLLAAPTPPADIPQVKTPVISKSKKSKPDAVSSPFVELVVAGSAVHATGGPNAATLRLDALDLILRGIRQLIQEHP